MRTPFQALGSFWLLLFFALPSSAASPYDEELSGLSAELRSIMILADQPGNLSPSARMELRKQLFEMSKKLHRLEEEALGANIELQQSGGESNRDLIYSASIANTLDLAQSLTSRYIETREKPFAAAAASAAKSARDLQAAQ